MSDFDPAVHSLAFVPHGGTAKDLDYCPAEDIAAALKPIINTDRYATALSLTVTDGQLTGSVTMSEGDPLTATVTLPDDVSVESGTYAVNAACQVTLPKSDGDSVTIDLCDLVSEMSQVVNPNGSITVTHSAGGVDETFTIPAPAPVYGACDIDGNVTIPAPDGTVFMTDAVANIAVQNGALCAFDKGGAIIETIQPNMRRFPVNVSGIKTVAADTDPVGTVVKAAEFTLTVPGKSVQRVPFHFILGLETAGNDTGDGSWNFRARISTNGATNGAPGFSNMRNHGSDSFRTLNVQGENRQEWWTFIDLAPGTYPIRMEYFVLGVAGDAGPVDIAVASAYADTHLFT